MKATWVTQAGYEYINEISAEGVGADSAGGAMPAYVRLGFGSYPVRSEMLLTPDDARRIGTELLNQAAKAEASS